MRPRNVVPPCKYCNKRFQRNEHLRRHERTHTKEKPYSCHCGQSFSRSDLLTRHTKIIHSVHTNKGATANDQGNRTASSSVADLSPSPNCTPRENAHSALDTRSEIQIEQGPFEVSSHIDAAATQHPQWSEKGDESAMPSTANQLLPGIASTHPEPSMPSMFFQSQPDSVPHIFDALDEFWNDFDINASLPMPASYANDYPMNFLPMFQYRDHELDIFDPNDNARPQDDPAEQGPLSRFASRLPSPHPCDDGELMSNTSGRVPTNRFPPPPNSRMSIGQAMPTPWRVSKGDYQSVVSVFDGKKHLLPTGFKFPSRHALCRYIEGYFSGFHEHLPFIHLPTFDITTEVPELVLAIAAVGARYRFQRQQSHHLYIAAKLLAEHQIRSRDGYEVPQSVFSVAGALSDSRTDIGTPESGGQMFGRTTTSATTSSNACTESGDRDVKTMQAVILLVALGTWNHKALLKDAFSMASHLAMMVREDNSKLQEHGSHEFTWTRWVSCEGRRRTKIVAFCFLNLHTITYNITPKLAIKEIFDLALPSPESHWRASNEFQWISARDDDPHIEVSIDERYTNLWREANEASHDHLSLSSFGNYVLIHCILQQIYLTKLSVYPFQPSNDVALPPDTLSKFNRALKTWQRHWEATKDSSLNPSAPSGPLSFNSTALFRLAHFRLHSCLGLGHQMETRNADSIAKTFRSAPPLERSTNVLQAVLQSVQSLSIPIRIGIEFVARTQTLTWSIIHSLVNLESGLFLCKWLETIATALTTSQSLREDEKRLIGIILNILDETDFSQVVKAQRTYIQQLKCMEMAVLRLWAQTFKGAHVFDIMGTIGMGLDQCADVMQKELGL